MTDAEILERYHKWNTLRKAGWTLVEIARYEGISFQAVQQRLAAGIPRMSGRKGWIINRKHG